MADQQQGCEQTGVERRRPVEIAVFVAGFVLALAFFAFVPGLPHVIDWGAIIVAVLVGVLARWICQYWMGKKSEEEE
ncbi:hypothetical protein JTP77_007115 [Streptomyces sp. S9]|nr:hypothetical protein [Streptomyces sp. S9]